MREQKSIHASGKEFFQKLKAKIQKAEGGYTKRGIGQ